MEVDAELLNVVYYDNKKTGVPSTWIKYRLLGEKYLVNSKKMIGYSILEEHVKNQNLKDVLKNNHCGVQCKITYDKKTLESNPLFESRFIKSIKIGNDVFSLV